MLLQGIFPPITTPFYADGNIYFKKLEHNVEHYSKTPVAGLTVLGSTGEAIMLSDEERRAARVADTIEQVLRGAIQLPEMVAKRLITKGRYKAFALEPEVMINNAWSDRYTMVEVTGLDRPGLLYELTSTLSRLNLNIGSAHVATFGERVVDVFYITDLFGAKITSATSAAAVEMLKVPALSPPVPQVSRRSSTPSLSARARERIALAHPAISSAVSPFIFSAIRNAAVSGSETSPSRTAPKARAASPAVISVGFSSRNWLELKRKRLPLPSSQLEERKSVIMAVPP